MSKEGVTEWYQSMVHPSHWMGCVCWSCMHVSCLYVSYTCIPCACFICMILIMVVVMSSCKAWCCYCGVHFHERMTSHILLYVSYLYHFACVVTFSYVWLHSCMIGTCIILVGSLTSIVCLCLITCVYACVWLVTHCLCMSVFACAQVYIDVVVVVMHEVLVWVVDKVMHWWLDPN